MIANERLLYTRPAPAWPWRLAVVVVALLMTVLTALIVPLTEMLSAPPSRDIEYRTVELSDWRPLSPPPPPLPRPLPSPAKPTPPQPPPQTPRLEEPSADPAPRLRLPVKLDFALGAVRADLALDFTLDPETRDLPETTTALAGAGTSTSASPVPLPPSLPPPPERFDRPPTIASQVKPQYPYAARSRLIEGQVDLQFTVTAQGRVEGATVLEAQPRNVFEEAALAAVGRWRFTPALRAGRAVPARLQVRISFTLEDP